jgi:hypothetical protein
VATLAALDVLHSFEDFAGLEASGAFFSAGFDPSLADEPSFLAACL